MHFQKQTPTPEPVAELPGLASPHLPASPRSWALPSDYQFDRYRTWFQEFTDTFLQGSAFDVGNVQLKIDHSLRVLELAQHLTTALAPPPELTALAHLAALFHDVGRFPQYARHKTFLDNRSVNHALQGVLTLKEQHVLAALPAAAQKLVLAAVALHNRRELPPSLEPTARFLTAIVRDADKLDIFAVMLAHFDPGSPPNKVVNLGLKVHPDHYTPAILRAVQQRQMVNYQQMVWINDFKLLLCSWIYYLNFLPSLKIARQRGYVAQLCNYLPQGGEFVRLRQQLSADLVKYAG